VQARSGEARDMAAGLRAAAQELQGVHQSSMQWAEREPTTGALAAPAAPMPAAAVVAPIMPLR